MPGLRRVPVIHRPVYAIPLLALLGLPLLAGCGEASGGSSTASWTELATIRFSEVASFGGSRATGAAAFGSVAAITLLPETRQLIVADGTSEQLHRFAIDGTHLATFGGEGGGPGEGRGWKEIWSTSRGEICAWDIQLQRVTRFDSLGNVLAVARPDLTDIRSIRAEFVGFFDDCSFVLRDTRAADDGCEGFRRWDYRHVRFGADGRSLGTLKTTRGPRIWCHRNSVGGRSNIDQIFGLRTMAFVRDGELWLGMNDSLRWSRIREDGTETSPVEMPTAVRTASDGDTELERQRRLDGFSVPDFIGGDARGRLLAGMREALEAVPARRLFPAYDEVLVGSDGMMWIREYPAPQDRRARWLVVSESNRVEGQIHLPRTVRLMAVSRTWLITESHDEYGSSVIRVRRRVDR